MADVPERHTHDYVRNGTTNLYAALDVGSGQVIADMTRRHRAEEFRPLLENDRRLSAGAPRDPRRCATAVVSALPGGARAGIQSVSAPGTPGAGPGTSDSCTFGGWRRCAESRKCRWPLFSRDCLEISKRNIRNVASHVFSLTAASCSSARSSRPQLLKLAVPTAHCHPAAPKKVSLGHGA